MAHRIRIEGQYGQLTRCREAFGQRWTAVAHAAAQRLPHHEHATAHVLFITAGGYKESEGGRELELPLGSIQFHRSGAGHCNLAGPRGGRIAAVELSPQFLAQLAEEGCPPRPQVIHAPDLCQRAVQEVAEDAADATLALQSVLFGALARMCLTPPPPAASAGLRRADERLRDLCSPPDLAELAGVAGCSRSQLVRAFRRHWRQSPGERLRALRLERARSLLLTSTYTIAEVATLCGYADQSHMTRAFHRSLGVTPGALRRRERN